MSIRYQDPESLTSLGSIGFVLVPPGFEKRVSNGGTG